MSKSRDVFRSALEGFDTKLTILTWMVDLAVTLLVLGLLLRG